MGSYKNALYIFFNLLAYTFSWAGAQTGGQIFNSTQEKNKRTLSWNFRSINLHVN